MRGRVLGARSRAVVVAVLGLGLAGCAADAGGPGGGGSPPIAALAATHAADAVVATRSAAATRSNSGRSPGRRARGRSGYPAVIGGLPRLGSTAPAPSRSRDASESTALDVAEAGRLAAPACATLRDAAGGRLPALVARRGQTRAPAVVTQAVAAALLGLPVDVPAAARTEHRRLVAAHAALTDALGAPGDAAANEAATARTALRAYARALGIDTCG